MIFKIYLKCILIFFAFITIHNALAITEIPVEAAGLAIGGDRTQIGIGGGYHHEVLSWLQAGVQAAYAKSAESGVSVDSFRLELGPTLNMDGAIPQAYFFSLGLAYREELGAFIRFGKRIPLTANLSFRPNFEVLAANGTSFMIHALSVSFFF